MAAIVSRLIACAVVFGLLGSEVSAARGGNKDISRLGARNNHHNNYDLHVRNTQGRSQALRRRSSGNSRRCKAKVTTSALVASSSKAASVTSSVKYAVTTSAAPKPTTSKAPAPQTTYKAANGGTQNVGNSGSGNTNNNGGGSKPPPSGAKKGLAWTSDSSFVGNFVNGAVGYIYGWDANPPFHSGLQSASMLWGYKNLDQFRQYRSQYPVLMGMNEVNLGAQANMDVGSGVALWNAEVRPYCGNKYCVTPSVTSAPDGLTWLQGFFQQCGGNDNCGASAVSLHYYGKDAAGLISYVTNMHNSLNNMDVWLSEFGCQDFTGGGDCSNDEIWAFMEGVTQWAESTSWVKMYAPFGLMTDLGNVAQGNALMTSSGSPTALGSWFLNN